MKACDERVRNELRSGSRSDILASREKNSQEGQATKCRISHKNLSPSSLSLHRFIAFIVTENPSSQHPLLGTPISLSLSSETPSLVTLVLQRKCLEKGPSGLIQLVLTVLILALSAAAAPSSQLHLRAPLKHLLLGALDICLDLPTAPLPPMQKRDAQHNFL